MAQYQSFDGGFEDRAEKSGMSWGIAAVAAAVLIGILIAATPNGARDCGSIANKDARLACFDAAAHAQPAKGAAIPTH